MASDWFHFKEFSIFQGHSAMKVCTDACLFGAYVAHFLNSQNETEPKSCLDVGAGTGLLSLMLAQKLPNTSFLALEPDASSFQDVMFNFLQSHFSERLTVESLKFEDFKRPNQEKFQLIICNPPFFTNHLKSPNQRLNDARHLDKEDWKNWLRFFSENLEENGWLFLLLAGDLGKSTQNLLPEFDFHCHIELSLLQKKNKNWRKVLAVKKEKPVRMQEYETNVYDESGNLSSEIKHWLSDYYLFL